MGVNSGGTAHLRPDDFSSGVFYFASFVKGGGCFSNRRDLPPKKAKKHNVGDGAFDVP